MGTPGASINQGTLEQLQQNSNKPSGLLCGLLGPGAKTSEVPLRSKTTRKPIPGDSWGNPRAKTSEGPSNKKQKGNPSGLLGLFPGVAARVPRDCFFFFRVCLFFRGLWPQAASGVPRDGFPSLNFDPRLPQESPRSLPRVSRDCFLFNVLFVWVPCLLGPYCKQYNPSVLGPLCLGLACASSFCVSALSV